MRTLFKGQWFTGYHDYILAFIRLGHAIVAPRSIFLEGGPRREVLEAQNSGQLP